MYIRRSEYASFLISVLTSIMRAISSSHVATIVLKTLSFMQPNIQKSNGVKLGDLRIGPLQ